MTAEAVSCELSGSGGVCVAMLPPSSAANHVEQQRGVKRELPSRIHRRTAVLHAAGKCGLCLFWLY